ncbi:MAG: helicase-related protein [Candidatus Woesearchaeota archaeon]|nr:helicase-related protein [Candidatus Woesearchaeota archaeon]
MKKTSMPPKEIEQLTDDPSLNIALDTIKIKKQALIFVNTKRSAEKTAEEIAKKLRIGDESLNELSEKALHAIAQPTRQCIRLSECLKKGVAFHHAGLHHKQKELIEESFRKGAIKIICSTPTLAYGLDLPAFRSVLKDLKRYGHQGYQYIPVLEFLQMAGRAGRPKFDSFGEAICIASSEPEKEKIYEKFILGEPEEISSKLAVEPVLRTYLLSLIASNLVNTKIQIMEFFEKTFWAFQFKDMEKLEAIILRMLGLLEEWKFIKSSAKEDFKSANALENESYDATLIGKRVAELYIDPLTAHHLITCLKNSSVVTVHSFSLLQIISHTLEMRPLLTVKTKEWDEVQEKLASYENNLLEKEPTLYEEEYDEYLNSVKTALFFEEWVNEKNEEYLLEQYNIRPGETRAKLNIADWLLYASEELSRILEIKPMLKEILKLRFRLKYGVKEELLPLMKLKHIGRARGRMLFNNGIKDIADVKKADLTALTQILGSNTAIDIKKQVGEDFEKMKVKENKRKGQISLADWGE